MYRVDRRFNLTRPLRMHRRLVRRCIQFCPAFRRGKELERPQYAGVFIEQTGKDGKPCFILASPESSANDRTIAVSRGDVAEIQLAKGAIRAGIQILLREAGIEAEAVEHFIVAGAFGTYIDIESAKRVGMFPDLPLDRFQQVGNAAGMGAVLLLLSEETRRAAAEAARTIHYVELTTYAAFHDEFIRYMTF